MKVSIERKPLFYTIFNNARYYSQGASLLYGNIFDGKKDAAYAAPGILCSTFCIELLLKCLLLIRHDDVFTKDDVIKKGIKIDEHAYSKIFKNIDSDLQDKTVLKFNDLFEDSISTQDYIGLLKKLGDKGFIKWRYIYETGKVKNLDIKLQNKIMDSLGKCIEMVLEEKKKT